MCDQKCPTQRAMQQHLPTLVDFWTEFSQLKGTFMVQVAKVWKKWSYTYPTWSVLTCDLLVYRVSCIFTAKRTSRVPGKKLHLNTLRELSIKLTFQMTTLLNVEQQPFQYSMSSLSDLDGDIEPTDLLRKIHRTYHHSNKRSDFLNWEAPEEETTTRGLLCRAWPSCEATRGQALTNETEAVKAEGSREVSGDSFHLSVEAAGRCS